MLSGESRPPNPVFNRRLTAPKLPFEKVRGTVGQRPKVTSGVGVDGFWLGVTVTVAGGIVLYVLQRTLAPFIGYCGLTVDEPTLENPYGKDNERSFPVAVRFLRVAIHARAMRLREVYGTLSIKSVEGEPFDSPGALHWQRQPRQGVAHPIGLHEALEGPDDARNHMYEFHFSHNSPVDIRSGDSDKLDLLLRLDGLDYAMPTVSRENRLPPGQYDIELLVHADNISRSKSYSWRIAIGANIAETAIVESA